MSQRPPESLKSIQTRITACRKCSRLVRWRESIAKKKTKRYAQWEYWGKPVPSFGDINARLLVVGLAPAAHGGNRTGRIFTGDESGNWLYRALHKTGFTNQPTSVDRNDGLILTDCYISAACHCAPPQNKLLPREIINCRPFMLRELELLKNLRVIVGLGKIGFDAVFDTVRAGGWTRMTVRPKFGHGAQYELNSRVVLLGSYHPSQQNTFTGRLTERMLDDVFRKSREILRHSHQQISNSTSS